jgi:predicted dehydrogenase
MNIAFVGCGYVFDIYMRTIRAHPEMTVRGVFDVRPERMRRVAEHYGFATYKSLDELLNDTSVEIVVNLTSISSHFLVSKAALEAGKHVYSEKPLTRSLAETQELFALAQSKGLRVGGAPSNIYSDTVRTLFEAVRQNAIGTPLLIYAELDDNPIHLMDFESIKSTTGAPWPVEEEIHEGCTFEHVGYHLIWICALLGPAIGVTAYSTELIDTKTPSLPGKVGTPDYSVACLHFANNATARITCSVVAPRDHRMRVIGTAGELSSEGYRHYRSPVFLEQFRKSNLTARKFRTLTNARWLGKLFGIGGRQLKLIRNAKSHAVETDNLIRSTFKQRLIEWLRRREVYAQDKLIGVTEFGREIIGNLPPFLTPDFLVHINELTLLIQGAGPEGLTARPSTSFAAIGEIPGNLSRDIGLASAQRKGAFESLLG